MNELYFLPINRRYTVSESVVTVWPELKLPYGLKEDTRIAPHILVRSSVFSTLEYAGAAQRPMIFKTDPLRLGAMSQYRVEQLEGPRLSQSDADVMFWLLSRVYRYGVPKDKAMVFFKRSEALTALGRSRGGKTDALLDDSLQRLCSAEFYFGERDKVTNEMIPLVRTRLLSGAERVSGDTKPYDYRVTIAEGMAALLENGSWVALSGQVREELASDPLARGLHAHFASNEKVHATLPKTLKGQMGRAGEIGQTKEMDQVEDLDKTGMQSSKWLHALRRALARVQAATGWSQCELVTAGQLAGKVLVRKGTAPRGPISKMP
jgi:hypothetical protein